MVKKESECDRDCSGLVSENPCDLCGGDIPNSNPPPVVLQFNRSGRDDDMKSETEHLTIGAELGYN